MTYYAYIVEEGNSFIKRVVAGESKFGCISLADIERNLAKICPNKIASLKLFMPDNKLFIIKDVKDFFGLQLQSFETLLNYAYDIQKSRDDKRMCGAYYLAALIHYVGNLAEVVDSCEVFISSVDYARYKMIPAASLALYKKLSPNDRDVLFSGALSNSSYVLRFNDYKVKKFYEILSKTAEF